MDVTGNWWGTNSPGAAQLYGPATYTPTIVLSLSANPATVLAPGATTLQATLQGGGYRVPDGTRLDWSSTFGALGAAWSVTTAGAAQTMLSAAGAGTAAVSVTEPCGFVVTTTVSFMAPTPSATASPTGTRTATPNAQPPTGTPTRTPTPPATRTPTASPSECVAAYVEAEAACAPGATSRPATRPAPAAPTPPCPMDRAMATPTARR